MVFYINLIIIFYSNKIFFRLDFYLVPAILIVCNLLFCINVIKNQRVIIESIDFTCAAILVGSHYEYIPIPIYLFFIHIFKQVKYTIT